jgi:hypothetical protein
MAGSLARVGDSVRERTRGTGMQAMRCLLISLAVMVLPAHAGDDHPAAVLPAKADIDAAIARGTEWLARHPAAAAGDGLADMLDEGVGYYVRRNLTPDAAERARLAERLQVHMARLAGLPEFEQWVYRGRKTLTDYYHLVLAAHLLDSAGEPDDLQAEITAQARRVLRVVKYCDPTKRLTIALFLQQLGADPGISLTEVLALSRIERIAQGRVANLPPVDASVQVLTVAALELYALVHEIVALTDFGHQPAPPWLAQRRDAVVRHLGEAVAWAAATGNFDLAAELLMSARLLQEPLTGNYRDAVQALTAGQQDDGSWGRQVTRRADKQRHAVLTATTALWVYLYAPAAVQAGDQVVY